MECLLPLDIRRKILLEVPYKDVLHARQSSEDLTRVCHTEKFWQEYNKYHYDIDPSLYLSGQTEQEMAEFIEELLQLYFSVGILPTVDSLKKVFSSQFMETVVEYYEYSGRDGKDVKNAIIETVKEFQRNKLELDVFPLNPSCNPSNNLKITVPFDDILASKSRRKFYEYMTKFIMRPTDYFSPHGIITLPFDASIFWNRYYFEDGTEIEDEFLHEKIFTDADGYGKFLYYNKVYPLFKNLGPG